jgi:predicted small metal-binding protein
VRRFECDHVVPGCDGVVTGDTDDEVLAAAAQHAADVHGMAQVPVDVASAIRAGITDA